MNPSVVARRFLAVSEPFIPFDATPEEIEERLTVLREGVPIGMRRSIVAWVMGQLKVAGSNWVSSDGVNTMENVLDFTVGASRKATDPLHVDTLENFMLTADSKMLLRIADYLLVVKRGANSGVLAKALRAGRSKYEVHVSDTSTRLRARVPEGVQEAAESLLLRGDIPGQLLSKAWNRLYELEADPSGAFAFAVKAVEAAAFAALGITDENATLSTAFRAIDNDNATWRLPFLREHEHYPSKDVLVGNMKLLFRAHRDRHGSADYTDVSQGEAEAAVLMAVTLVGWFTGGLVQERDTGTFA